MPDSPKLNPLVSNILEALETKKESTMLDFGWLKIIDKINAGQQGIVVKAVTKNDKPYAIKFYAPSDDDPLILKSGERRFKREAEYLAKIQQRALDNLGNSCSSNSVNVTVT